ncbi:MAG: hypothetical protein MRJ92_10385 [Nitrospira sp.]|nr:hypothetical protein [Nitrospira sp.]
MLLREELLVAFFWRGWRCWGDNNSNWLQPILSQLRARRVFRHDSVTAFTDNAALTYLGSLVEGLSDAFKYAGGYAVTGGGLTVIANAPNPAGLALLRNHFEEESVSPAKLALAAPTDHRGGWVAFCSCEILLRRPLSIREIVVPRCERPCPIAREVSPDEDLWPSQPIACLNINEA